MTYILAYLSITLVGLLIGAYLGLRERGRWDAHKAEAKADEGEKP